MSCLLPLCSNVQPLVLGIHFPNISDLLHETGSPFRDVLIVYAEIIKAASSAQNGLWTPSGLGHLGCIVSDWCETHVCATAGQWYAIRTARLAWFTAVMYSR